MATYTPDETAAGPLPDIANTARIIHIPEPVYGPCPVCGAEEGAKCPVDCPGAPLEPHDEGCTCQSYDTNPPADRRLPALHQTLHAAQTAYDVLFGEIRTALRQQPTGDYRWIAQCAAEELDDAIKQLDRMIDDVAAGRI